MQEYGKTAKVQRAFVPVWLGLNGRLAILVAAACGNSTESTPTPAALATGQPMAAATASPTATAAATVPLNGAGATFLYLLYSQWFADLAEVTTMME